LYSNSLTEFKTSVIKRIARHFYPAMDQEIVSLEIFDKFVLRVKRGTI
jgi:hypothetical protein